MKNVIAGIIWVVIMAIPYTIAALCCIISLFTDPFGWSLMGWYSERFRLFSRFVGAILESKIK